MSQSISALPVRAKVKDTSTTYYGVPIIWEIGDKNHAGYPANSVTLVAANILKLACFDAKESGNGDSSRRNYGNNRYSLSNLRQWLNKSGSPWYQAQHGADAAPTNANVWDGYNEYDDEAGFLTGFSAQMLAAILNTTLTVAKASVDGGGSETVTDKVFLLSKAEVGLGAENGVSEGSTLAMFSDNSGRQCRPTAQAVSNSEYKTSSLSASQYWHYYLRSPIASNSYHVRYVSSDGTLSYCIAYNGYSGVRPALNLSSSILVSDNPNSSGNYEIIYNTAPSAPPSITAPKQCYSGQNIEISCAAATDPDGDALTYVFERSANSGSWTQVQSSAARTFSEMVSTAWNTLQYRVKAVDTAGNSSAYTTSGAIAVIHNQPPVISGQNADLGVKREDFTYEYSVTDPDKDVVNVVEKIDGSPFNTRNNITLGATLTLSVSGDTFTALTNAQHTIEIVATDSAGNSATRTLTFTKAINSFVISLSEPLEANRQPTRCNIKVNRDIPAGGTFKVEACNNPYDVAPIWEDCTNAVIAGLAHVFKNKTNTAVQFGLNIRVTVERGDALTACWVSGIGGNFE